MEMDVASRVLEFGGGTKLQGRAQDLQATLNFLYTLDPHRSTPPASLPDSLERADAHLTYELSFGFECFASSECNAAREFADQVRKSRRMLMQCLNHGSALLHFR
jgi:hypothetical protein